jgi:hypothetical protein
MVHVLVADIFTVDAAGWVLPCKGRADLDNGEKLRETDGSHAYFGHCAGDLHAGLLEKMKPRPPLFPSLDSGANLADLQVRLTLAMGLVPLGIVFLLVAAGAPDWPSPGLWAGAGTALGGMALMGGLWRRSGNRTLRGFSTAQFLIRYLFIVLCPVLLWIVFGDVILDLGGIFPPILLGLLLLVYPVDRILRERVGADPMLAPRIEMAHIACQQIQMVLGIFAITGLISGAILDKSRDYPTDPAPLLLLLWMLALLSLLAGAVMGFAHWIRLFTKPLPPQPLDDEPPPAAPKQSLRFGSEKF